MNVTIVSGIWPPDVGGPASHAPEVAEFLRDRGHRVRVVTTAATAPAPEPYDVRWVSRRHPRGIRHAVVARAIARAARDADVVYTTGMIVRTALGAAAARTPFVVKLTSDPTYERSIRYRLTTDDLDTFQARGDVRVRALRRARDVALSRAAHVIIPSASLRDLAVGWGVPSERTTVLPNPIAPPPQLPDRDEVRRTHSIAGPTLVFAGRLAPQKRVDVALEALAEVPGVSLVIAGDGPSADEVRATATRLGLDARVRFLGAQPRQAVFELLRAADAVVLSSSWENFPHVVVEALAVGTPVIATAVGGVTEVVRDGGNGLLVPLEDAPALADAFRRFFADDGLRSRLRAGTGETLAEFSPDDVYGRLEDVLRRAAR